MSEGNGYATLEDLTKGISKRRFRDVVLPVSGWKLRLQSITERELSAYQASLVSSGGRGLRKDRMKEANMRFIALCLVDADGNRLLSGQDVNSLSSWDAADSGFLYTECALHCGINSDDIEELVKNSDDATVDA